MQPTHTMPLSALTFAPSPSCSTNHSSPSASSHWGSSASSHWGSSASSHWGSSASSHCQWGSPASSHWGCGSSFACPAGLRAKFSNGCTLICIACAVRAPAWTVAGIVLAIVRWCICCCIGWCTGWSISWCIGRCISWCIGWCIIWYIGRSIIWYIGRSISRCISWSISWCIGWCIICRRASLSTTQHEHRPEMCLVDCQPNLYPQTPLLAAVAFLFKWSKMGVEWGSPHYWSCGAPQGAKFGIWALKMYI